MTSPFEKLPYEVVDNIAACLSDYKDDLRQFQLANKRCQSVAEKQLFKELELPSQNPDQHKLFLEKPQRCSYVRTLKFSGDPDIAFEDDFFDRFRYIESVCASDKYDVDISWQFLSTTFTPERCRLKELPFRFEGTRHAEKYLKMLRDHSHTLERLAYLRHDPRMHSELEEAGRSFGLPQLKSLRFVQAGPNFHGLCDVIDKFPSLEIFRLEVYEKNRVMSQTPTTQHQEPVKRVSFRCYSINIANVCTYLATKFPKTQEWEIFTVDLAIAENGATMAGNGATVAPFEEYMKSLHLIMKSMRVKLTTIVKHSSIPNVFDLIEKLEATTTTTSIEYQDSIDHGEVLDSVILVLQKRRTKDFTVTLLCPWSAFDNLSLLEKLGHRVQKLNLSLRSYDYGFSKQKDDLQKGGMLAHLLNNCNALTSLTYRADTLSTIDPKKANNKSLKKMTLVCNTIEGDSLACLSEIAPNISYLTIKSSFDAKIRSETETQININMQRNSFDKLILRDSAIWGCDSNILLRISTSTPMKVRCYIQKYKRGKRGTVTSLSEEEYNTHHNERKYASIDIRCKSISYLNYYFDVDSMLLVPGISEQSLELQL